MLPSISEDTKLSQLRPRSRTLGHPPARTCPVRSLSPPRYFTLSLTRWLPRSLARAASGGQSMWRRSFRTSATS
eukprot:2100325-Rhodomonas_salina.1